MSASLIERTPSAYDYPLLIKHLLHIPLAIAPEQEIVYRDVSRFPYRLVRQRIGQLASGLTALGVRPGDTVAVMDWDSHRYLECFFAIPMMGAVLQTVNIRLSPEQILYTLNHAKADVILCHTDFLPVLESLKERLETVKTFVVLSDGGAVAERPPSTIEVAAEYEELLARSAEDFDFPDFDEHTRATTFYTTGTTGNPKGVYFSHRQLVLHTLAALGSLASPAAQQRLHRGDVYMPITPMFHVHAWGLPYVATAMGIKQVYPGRYLPDVLLALIQREKVTFSHCVPTILHMMLSSPAAGEVDLSGWKVIIGGSALPKGLAKLAIDRGIDVFTGYGMSETCPIMSLAQLKSSMTALDSDQQIDYRTRAGLPIQLVDLRVVDEQMRDVPHDGQASGEVVARAPWLTQGYLNDPANSEQLWRGGYLHTSDIGTINPEGYLQITDRIKDVVKSGGEWISSLAIEDLISQYPGMVPPQINKFYVFDLSPKKSLVQYALSNGLQVFMISWRNPTLAQRDWGLDTYIGAIGEAIDVVCAISGSPDCNLLGACSGGITTVAFVGYLAARGKRSVHGLTLLVSVFDTGNDQTTLGLFATEEAIEAARRHSHVQGVLEGKEMARVFSWLRPNDLIWNYWVNNYLLGHEPPAFDVLYWNNDTTRLPAALHSEFLTIYQHNPLAHARALTVRGTPIDVSQITCDVYVLAGSTDHITPWQACYRSSRLLGGQREFILSTSGHIQSILNPPGNPKATFFTNAEQPADAQAWYAGATRHSGSWWENWKAWLLARSGSQKAAPPSVGNSIYTPLVEAPGTYVYE